MKRKGLLILLIIIILGVSLIGSRKEGFRKIGSGGSCKYDINCDSDNCMRDIEGKLKCSLKLEPEKVEGETETIG
jgi:hypothetical protein|tara:strand:+ start:1899 stop:2123 length:225 start_codon:yes stop_codon:yes gene_type:complete